MRDNSSLFPLEKFIDSNLRYFLEDFAFPKLCGRLYEKRLRKSQTLDLVKKSLGDSIA